MILVDEYAALPALVGRPPASLASEPLALTYSRAYRLTRALLDPGPGRLQTRGRFTRLADALEPRDRHALSERLAEPDPAVLTVVDPRPLTRTAGAIQNTYAVSLLQAETLAAAVTQQLADQVRRARQCLGSVPPRCRSARPRPGGDRRPLMRRVQVQASGHRLVTNDDGRSRMSPDGDRRTIATTCENPDVAGSARTTETKSI